MYGKGILELSVKYRSLINSLRAFGSKISDYRVSSSVNFASDHLAEFLCDTYGVLVCGGSYVFGYISDFLSGGKIKWNRERYGTHPPYPLRLKLMIKMLNYVGHKNLALEAEEYFIGSDPEKEMRVGFADYSDWIDDNISLFEDFVDCLADHIGIDNAEEQKLLTRYDEIVGKIIQGDPILPEYNSIDILNSVWHKIKYRPDNPRYQMMWRLAFKYCS